MTKPKVHKTFSDHDIDAIIKKTGPLPSATIDIVDAQGKRQTLDRREHLKNRLNAALAEYERMRAAEK